MPCVFEVRRDVQEQRIDVSLLSIGSSWTAWCSNCDGVLVIKCYVWIWR